MSLDACPLAVASVERNVKREFNIILIGCIIFVGIASMHGRFGRNQLQLVAFLLIVAFSLLTKYGTFRTLHNSVGASGIRHVDAKGNVIFYDHKETDEKIFEVLMALFAYI